MIMKKLKVEELIPGMITAEDIYNYNDQLILPTGLVLTSKAISKLQFYGIYQIRIKDEMAPAEKEITEIKPARPAEENPKQPAAENASDSTEKQPTAEDTAKQPVKDAPTAPEKSLKDTPAAAPQKERQPASDQTKREPGKVSKTAPIPSFFSSSSTSYMDKVKESEDFRQFRQAFNEEVQDFKSKINEVVLKNAPLDVDELLDDALKLVARGSGTFSIFNMLHSMRQNDDETYAHCLNVGLFCNVFAGWLKLSEEETKIATLCGLLHDLGKMKLPEDLLKKPTPYTEEDLWAAKKHAYEGYQLVKNLDIDNHVKNAVLTHHERIDGSGYPFGLRGNKIDPYARMVAIADVYDAMTSVRAYRNAMSPFQAVQIMQEEGLQKYDVRFIMTFLENVMNTFIGNRVLLSTGERGEIVFIHKSDITRPTVKCGGHYVDMSIEKNIEIVALM